MLTKLYFASSMAAMFLMSSVAGAHDTNCAYGVDYDKAECNGEANTNARPIVDGPGSSLPIDYPDYSDLPDTGLSFGNVGPDFLGGGFNPFGN
jgi:hypothetical protein